MKGSLLLICQTVLRRISSNPVPGAARTHPAWLAREITPHDLLEGLQ